MARRTFFVMFGILLVSCTILFTSRQLIYASSKTERQYNVQLSKWKGNRDQSIESERVRFQQALDDSQAKEAERIRAVGEEKNDNSKPSLLQEIRVEHEEELRLLEVEHRLKQERIEEAMTSKVVSAVKKTQLAKLTAEQFASKQATMNDYRAKSKEILSWYCALSQTKLDKLVHGCQHITTFGAEASCISGDDGLPTAELPPLTLAPNVVDNQGLKHVTVVKFDSPVLSRSIASLARVHMDDHNNNSTMNQFNRARVGGAGGRAGGGGGNLPPSDVYRGATILMHPWLGFFYRVRVPASSWVADDGGGGGGGGGETEDRERRSTTEGGDKQQRGGAVDEHSYRQECFRRPWAFLSREDRLALSPLKKRTATSLRTSESSESLESSNNQLIAVLMLHSQTKLASVTSLIQSTISMNEESSAAVKLVVALCPIKNDCLTEKEILQELDEDKTLLKKIKNKNNVVIRSASSSLTSLQNHNLWSTWRITLDSVLTFIADDQQDDRTHDNRNRDRGDTPIVLLDGHTSQLDPEYIHQIQNHLHSKAAQRFGLLPMSKYRSPTHRWKEIYYDKPFANHGGGGGGGGGGGAAAVSGASGAGVTPVTPSGGYVERWVVPVAFTLKDGLAAVAAWPESEESGRSSGSGVQRFPSTHIESNKTGSVGRQWREGRGGGGGEEEEEEERWWRRLGTHNKQDKQDK